MSKEQEHIEHLETLAHQRAGLMAIISGVFMSPTRSEDEAMLKARIANGIMSVIGEHELSVGDFIETMTVAAIQSWTKEQVELEKLKAVAEGREWGEE